jgi:hypothetical protein
VRMSLLANCKIQELVNEYVNNYLSQSNLSFIELKTFIINKLPVPEVQIQIIKKLTDAKKSDLDTVHKRLQKNILTAQLKADEQEIAEETSNAAHDKELKEKITHELERYPQELSKLESSLSLRRFQLSQTMEYTARTQVLNRPSDSNFSLQDDAGNQTTIQQIQSDIVTTQLKIKSLEERKRSHQKRLAEIARRVSTRQEHQTKRNFRQQAIEAFNSTGEGIDHALSSTYQSQLNRSIQSQKEALEKKYIALIEEAAEINYPSFLEALTDHIKDLTLTNQESEALQSILKLMRQHLSYAAQAASAQQQIDTKKRNLVAQQNALKTRQDKFKQLSSANPSISSSNKKLSDENTTLKTALEKNTKLRQSLTTPAMLLTGLTFVSIIPLILALKGIIPIIVSTLLTVSLFSALPTLLLCAALGTGIAAIVFAVRAQSNENTLKINLQTIVHNNSTKKRNAQEVKNLEETIIPNLIAQLENTKNSIRDLEHSMAESQRLAEQALQQAKTITPASFAVSSILTPATTNPLPPNESIKEEEEQEEEEKMEEEKEPIAQLTMSES